jgi:hypothetical protein
LDAAEFKATPEAKWQQFAVQNAVPRPFRFIQPQAAAQFGLTIDAIQTDSAQPVRLR